MLAARKNELRIALTAAFQSGSDCSGLRSTDVGGSDGERRDGRYQLLRRFQPVLGDSEAGAGAHARRLLVLVEVALERERLAAAGARVGLVDGVRLDVRAQVGLVGERLGALRTAERSLARMRANVSL